jgi:predicted nicotinamide N-methyase
MFDELFGAREGDTSDEDDALEPEIVVEKDLPPICFKFGSVSVEMPADGTTLAQKIWSSSLIASALISGCLTVNGEEPTPESASTALVGKHVLEIGCGRGLAGIVAGKCGAVRVVHSDCDDRCLVDLEEMNLNHGCVTEDSRYLLRHHLWEQDKIFEEEGEGAPRVRHTSDSHRNERIFEMEQGTQFDVVIAADCLYFQNQEEPLASVLRQRVRKPDGRAVICMQPRHENSFMFNRLIDMLRSSGFAIHHQNDFEWTKLMEKDVMMQSGYQPALVPNAKSGGGVNRYYIVVATWPEASA